MFQLRRRLRSFNSRLREEATCAFAERGEGEVVSTHASVRRRRGGAARRYHRRKGFNSRLREEATPLTGLVKAQDFEFQLTPP